MATKKEETPEQTVTHHEYAKDISPQILNAVEQLEQLKATNQITRAFKVKSKELRKGNQKQDENRNPLFNQDGTPQMWADRYTILTTSEDGRIDVKVSEEQFGAINVGQWYMAVGHVEIYTPYEGMPRETIKYDDFQPLFGVQA